MATDREAGQAAESDPGFTTAMSELGITADTTVEEFNGDPGQADVSSQGDGEQIQERPDGAPGTPPEAGEGGTPDAAADPYAGTEPFTYTVNGESRQLEGVYQVPGQGLIIPEEHRGVLTTLAERAAAFEQAQTEWETQRALTDRLSTWQTTDASGQPQTVSGAEGLVEMRVALGNMEAENKALVRALTEPGLLAELIGLNAQNEIVPNPRGLQFLLSQVQASQLQAEKQIRNTLGQVRSERATASSPAADPARYAPQVITQVMQQAKLDATSLTAQDRTFLAEQLPYYLRQVTPEDRRQNPSLTLGAPIVDGRFASLVTDRAALRAQAIQSAKTGQQAGKFNAGQKAGVKAPTAPAKTAPAKPAGRPSSTPPKADWDTPLANALAELGISR